MVIDTLERVRTQKGRRNSLAYSDDVALGALLQKVASDFNVAIVAIHHLRKEGATDDLDTVSGTRPHSIRRFGSDPQARSWSV